MMKTLILNFFNIYSINMILLIMLILLIPMKFNNIHPLNLIIILILYTFLLSMKINYMFKTWMNFILILIMIGGLMIIFMYITSISNNNIFMIQYKNIMINIFKMFFILMIYSFWLKFMNFKFFYNSQDLWNFNYNMLEENNEVILSKMFNFNKYSTIYIMLYLYFSMLCILSICLKMKNPLRQLFNYE